MRSNYQNIQAVLAAALFFTSLPILALSQESRDPDDDEIEEIVVTGRAQQFYRIDKSSTATKTPTEFLSIPQGLQVLTRQLIEDQAATRITELYRSISGVTEFSYSGVTIRGFRQEEEVRYDGVMGDPFTGFSVPQLFNIERVEVLKGPSSMLYGVAEPGGLINYVTKKPTPNGQGRVTVFAGDYDHFGVSGEFSGPLNDAGNIRGRIGGYNQKKKPWRNNTSEDNTIIDGSVEFDVGDNTTLLFQATRVEQELFGHRIRGIPVDDAGNFLADITWNAAEPTDFQSLEATIFQVIGNHDFRNGVSSSVTLRQFDNEQLQEYHEPRAIVDTDDDGVVDAQTREFRDQFRAQDEFSITWDNVFQTTLGAREHMILIGADYFDSGSDRDLRDTPDFPISEALSFADAVYGLVDFVSINAALEADAANGASLWFVDQMRYGVYMQDQFDLTDRLEGVLGLRYDSFDARDERPSGILRGDFDDSNLSFRGGLIYRPVKDISTYLAYSEAFLPQFVGNQDASNGPFDPLTSVSYELGVKTDLYDGRLQASAVIYQMTKQNLLQTDPSPTAPPDALIALGEVQSEGLEIDLIADITDRWVMMFNYAYNETEIVEGIEGSSFNSPGFGNLNLVGQTLVNAPKNTVGIWTRYEIPGINSSIAGGMDYVDDRINFNGQTVKSYTVFDLSWQTNWNNLNFQINVKNLSDEQYAVSGFDRGDFPGEPRTVLFQVSADFAEF